MKATPLLLVGFAMLLVTASCGASSDVVELTVHLGEGQAWAMAGDPVDAEVVCEGGRRQPVGWLDLDGKSLTFEEWVPLFEQARNSNGTVVNFYLEYQFVCADGSGSFRVKEHADRDRETWEVEGGTDAYADLSGSGECTMVTAPIEPGDPPQGLPMRLDCVGMIR